MKWKYTSLSLKNGGAIKRCVCACNKAERSRFRIEVRLTSGQANMALDKYYDAADCSLECGNIRDSQAAGHSLCHAMTVLQVSAYAFTRGTIAYSGEPGKCGLYAMGCI